MPRKKQPQNRKPETVPVHEESLENRPAAPSLWVRLIAIAFVVAFLTLAYADIASTAPTFDETTHLAAGWSYLESGDFRLNPEHPPLIKMIAALPLRTLAVWPPHLRDDGSRAFSALEETWKVAPANTNAQWFYAHQLLYGRRDSVAPDTPTTVALPRTAFLNDPDAMFRRARLLLLILCGVGLALVIACWSYELWGAWGALLALGFFCFDPNLIAHGGLVTTDAGVTLMIAAAAYFFWRCSRNLTVWNCIAFILFASLAQVVKFSALLLFPMMVLLMLVVRVRRGRDAFRRLATAAAISVAGSFAAVWLVYGLHFRASTQPLPLRDAVEEWYARQSLLSTHEGFAPEEAVRSARANVHVGTLGRLLYTANERHLLPEAYLVGFARLEDSGVTRTAYLNGVVSETGFRSYFLWVFLFKTPIPTIIAVVAALILAARRKARETLFLLGPVAVYLAASLTAHINIGIRHLLPIYPFLYVLCGSLPRRFFAAVLLSGLSCLVVFAPANAMWGRHLSYFNELAGGPRNGYQHLADSNADWGQDLPRLAAWLRERRVTEPLNLVYFGSADPQYYGIRYLNLDGGYFAAPEQPLDSIHRPALLAISATKYSGATMSPQEVNYWRDVTDRLRGKLIDRVGYSILIFRVE